MNEPQGGEDLHDPNVPEQEGRGVAAVEEDSAGAEAV